MGKWFKMPIQFSEVDVINVDKAIQRRMTPDHSGDPDAQSVQGPQPNFFICSDPPTAHD